MKNLDWSDTMDKKYIEYYGLMLYKFENLLYDNDNGSLMDYMSTFFDHVLMKYNRDPSITEYNINTFELWLDTRYKRIIHME